MYRHCRAVCHARPTMQDVDPGSTTPDRPASRRKQSVSYRTEQPPGTIIVNTADRYLYLIMGNGIAMRYGVGVGRDGFQWGGIQTITLNANGRTGCRRRR